MARNRVIDFLKITFAGSLGAGFLYGSYIVGWAGHSLWSIVNGFYAIVWDPTTQWMVLLCLATWLSTLFLAWPDSNDLPLVGLLIIAGVAYSCHCSVWPVTDAITLFAGLAVGKATSRLLSRSGIKTDIQDTITLKVQFFLLGLVGLLAFPAWLHSNRTFSSYRGPRWTGLWDNPNVYGTLMVVGLVLATGMLVGTRSRNSGLWNRCEALPRRLLQVFLLIAMSMTGIGLICSYSRGACFGGVAGMLYLAKAYRRFKWRFVLPGILLVGASLWLFWNATPESAPWYLKRLDFGRASVQHRLAAWRGGLKMMWDHPFGVGWNNAVIVYGKNYSAPEDGAAALATNDYFMLGTQLGWPGLMCFLGYVGLRLRKCQFEDIDQAFVLRTVAEKEGSQIWVSNYIPGVIHRLDLRVACRAGAATMLVAFWFDGGLFAPAIGAVFWVLLELGSEKQGQRTKQIL